MLNAPTTPPTPATPPTPTTPTTPPTPAPSATTTAPPIAHYLQVLMDDGNLPGWLGEIYY